LSVVDGQKAAGRATAVSEPDPVDPQDELAPEAPEGSGPGDRWPARWSTAAFAIAVLPLVVACVRGIRQGWVPVGDTAVIAIRSRDVFGGEAPLLGMWSTTSWTVGFDVNHPGPLLFDVLAVPTELFGGGYAGFLVANTLLHVGAVLGIWLAARRRGGHQLGILAMAIVATLSWSMGSDVLMEPWHAHSVLLPFLWFLLLVWSVTRADLVSLPLAVAVGSLVVQTNLSYAVLVPALLVWAAGGLLLEVRRRARRPTGADGALPARRVLTAVGVSVLVGVVCWLQPLIEQFTGDGEGNLTRMVRSTAEATATMAPLDAVRTVANVVAVPPFLLRPSFAEAFTRSALGHPLPATALALGGLLLVAGLLVVGALAARRDGDREALSLVMTAGFALVLAVVTADQLPWNAFGAPNYQLTWLWPLAAFVVFALATALVRRLEMPERRVRWLAGGVVVLTAAVAIANLPASNQGTTARAGTLAVTHDLLRQLDRTDLPPDALLQCYERVQDPYCEAVMAHLQRRDVDFVSEDPTVTRQLGAARRFDGDNAASRIVVAAGEGAELTPAGSKRLAVHLGLGEGEREELRRLRADLERQVADGGLRLNGRGRSALRRGTIGDVEHALDVEALFGGRQLVTLVKDDLLVVDDDVARRFERYVDLQERMDDDSVVVYTDAELPG
jgi:hypothetical protein